MKTETDLSLNSNDLVDTAEIARHFDHRTRTPMDSYSLVRVFIFRSCIAHRWTTVVIEDRCLRFTSNVRKFVSSEIANFGKYTSRWRLLVLVRRYEDQNRGNIEETTETKHDPS